MVGWNLFVHVERPALRVDPEDPIPKAWRTFIPRLVILVFECLRDIHLIWVDFTEPFLLSVI